MASTSTQRVDTPYSGECLKGVHGFSQRNRIAWVVSIALLSFLQPSIAHSNDSQPAAEKSDVVVIGEGASGLATAVAAKRECPACRVIVLEKRLKDRLLRVETPVLFQQTLNTLAYLGARLDPRAITYFAKRKEVDPKGNVTETSIPVFTPDPKHNPYEVRGLLPPHIPIAAASIGDIEESLRNTAKNLGVEFQYGANVVALRSTPDGVRMIVRRKILSAMGVGIEAGVGVEVESTLFSKRAVVATGANGTGAEGAKTKEIGSIPTMAAITKRPGDRVMEVRKLINIEKAVPGEVVTTVRIGHTPGTALLVELPRGLIWEPQEAQREWFYRMAENHWNTPRSDFATEPVSFPGAMSAGRPVEGHIYYVGDRQNTVPVFSASGLSKGIGEGVDAGTIIGKQLRNPSLSETNRTLLTKVHSAMAYATQNNFIFGLRGVLGTHLRSERGPQLSAERKVPSMHPYQPRLGMHSTLQRPIAERLPTQ